MNSEARRLRYWRVVQDASFNNRNTRYIAAVNEIDTTTVLRWAQENFPSEDYKVFLTYKKAKRYKERMNAEERITFLEYQLKDTQKEVEQLQKDFNSREALNKLSEAMVMEGDGPTKENPLKVRVSVEPVTLGSDEKGFRLVLREPKRPYFAAEYSKCGHNLHPQAHTVLRVLKKLKDRGLPIEIIGEGN